MPGAFGFEQGAARSYSSGVPIPGYILTALTAYLIGSVPTGFLVGKARGIDIRALGSGNIGATNVFRNLGTAAGILVLLADAFKGWLAVFLAGACFARAFGASSPEAAEWFKIVGGFFAIVGHNYTCWLRFRGGKGIATSAGVLVGLVPVGFLAGVTLFVLVLLAFRYVSLASISAALVLPFATWWSGQSVKLIAITAVMTAMAIYKHRTNIQRLLRGTESRLWGKKPTAGDTTKST